MLSHLVIRRGLQSRVVEYAPRKILGELRALYLSVIRLLNLSSLMIARV